VVDVDKGSDARTYGLTFPTTSLERTCAHMPFAEMSLVSNFDSMDMLHVAEARTECNNTAGNIREFLGGMAG